MAVAFLLSADRSWYGKLIEELMNDFLKGSNNYPESIVGAYCLLNNWWQDSRNAVKVVGDAEGVTFLNDKDTDAEEQEQEPRQDNWKKRRRCRICGKCLHLAYECPSKGKEDENSAPSKGADKKDGGMPQDGVNALLIGLKEGNSDDDCYLFLQLGEEETHTSTIVDVRPPALETKTEDGDKLGYVFLQKSAMAGLLDDWIILDTGSTVDIFQNWSLLTNIRTVNKSMTIKCNTGCHTTNQMGTLQGYGSMWLSEHAISNILSFSNVKEKYPVSYSSINGNQFTVHKPTYQLFFNESLCGLYFH